jgi:hypothetical protein
MRHTRIILDAHIVSTATGLTTWRLSSIRFTIGRPTLPMHIYILSQEFIASRSRKDNFLHVIWYIFLHLKVYSSIITSWVMRDFSLSSMVLLAGDTEKKLPSHKTDDFKLILSPCWNYNWSTFPDVINSSLLTRTVSKNIHRPMVIGICTHVQEVSTVVPRF